MTVKRILDRVADHPGTHSRIMGSENPDKQPVPLAGDEERPMPDARRQLARRPKG
jgi:hypothetical protein